MLINRVLFSIGLIFAIQASADVYKCVDDKGRITFSDRVCGGVKISETRIEIQNANAIRRVRPEGADEDVGKYEEPPIGRRVKNPKVVILEDVSIGPNSERSRNAEKRAICDGAKPHERGLPLTAKQSELSVACDKRTTSLEDLKRIVERYRNNQRSSPPSSAPSIITSCDASGCWDNQGKRYNSTGDDTGNAIHQDGRFCQRIGDQFMCH